MEDIIKRIMQLMKKNNLSSKKTAELLGVSASIISDWKSGRLKPSIEHIVKLALIFNVTTDYILIGHERELPDDVQLQEGYDFEDNKVTIPAEQAALVREMINRELNELVEEAVRKVLGKDTSESTGDKG